MRSGMIIGVLALSLGTLSTAEAQWSLRQTRADYAQPQVYNADDPWTKGSVYRTQTGHSGWFYNCDEEECKRHSPYICWKSQDNTEHIRSYWSVIKADWREVKQRIRSGACLGPECESCPPGQVCQSEGATPGCNSCQVPMTSQTGGVGLLVESAPAAPATIGTAASNGSELLGSNAAQRTVMTSPLTSTTGTGQPMLPASPKSHLRVGPAKSNAPQVAETANSPAESTAAQPASHLRRR